MIAYSYLPVQLQKRHLLLSVCSPFNQLRIVHTISSLHIGHTILEVAAAAAGAEPCSLRATFAAISSCSVDSGVLEVWLLSDIELSEGDKIAGLRVTGGLFGGGGGARFFPVPSTLPPPKLLLFAISHRRNEFILDVVNSPPAEGDAVFHVNSVSSLRQDRCSGGASDRVHRIVVPSHALSCECS